MDHSCRVCFARRGSVERGRRVTVKILFVEDSQADVELQLRACETPGSSRSGTGCRPRTRYDAALADESWQVALVDSSA